jgi:hypothetical protein
MQESPTTGFTTGVRRDHDKNAKIIRQSSLRVRATGRLLRCSDSCTTCFSLLVHHEIT